jgi:hypothetical protein
METLRKNATITQSYIIKLEQLQTKFNIEKRKIRTECSLKSNTTFDTDQTTVPSSEFPTILYEELTTLKIQYDSLIAKEKEETNSLMTEYTSLMTEYKSND